MTHAPTACASCSALTPFDLLDAKDDGTGDFNRFECRLCYGPGWSPGVMFAEPFHRGWLSTLWLSLILPALRRVAGRP